jgi:cell division septation protein DedD
MNFDTNLAVHRSIQPHHRPSALRCPQRRANDSGSCVSTHTQCTPLHARMVHAARGLPQTVGAGRVGQLGGGVCSSAAEQRGDHRLALTAAAPSPAHARPASCRGGAAHGMAGRDGRPTEPTSNTTRRCQARQQQQLCSNGTAEHAARVVSRRKQRLHRRTASVPSSTDAGSAGALRTGAAQPGRIWPEGKPGHEAACAARKSSSTEIMTCPPRKRSRLSSSLLPSPLLPPPTPPPIDAPCTRCLRHCDPMHARNRRGGSPPQPAAVSAARCQAPGSGGSAATTTPAAARPASRTTAVCTAWSQPSSTQASRNTCRKAPPPPPNQHGRFTTPNCWRHRCHRRAGQLFGTRALCRRDGSTMPTKAPPRKLNLNLRNCAQWGQSTD